MQMIANDGVPELSFLWKFQDVERTVTKSSHCSLQHVPARPADTPACWPPSREQASPRKGNYKKNEGTS